MLSQIVDVRSLLPKEVNVIALTATATSQLHVQVTKMLGMKNELVVSLSPCKQNITYAVGTFNTISETFSPILDRLSSERSKYPQTIIYCRRYKDCADLYFYFKH